MTGQRIGKEQKHARNREKLTAAAQSVLLQKGYARTSLREIANAAEVPLGTLHYYFNDKSELMISAFRTHQTDFIESIRHIASSDGNALEKCRRVAANWSDKLMQNGTAYLIWYDLRNQALFEPDLRPVILEMEVLQVAALAELINGDTPLDAAAIQRIRDYYLPLLGGLFHRFLQRIIFGDRADQAQQTRAFTDVLVQLLAELNGASERRSQHRQP